MKEEITLSELLEMLAEDKRLAERMAKDPIQCLTELGVELSEKSRAALELQTFEKRHDRIAEAVYRGDEDGVTCCSVFGFHANA